MTEVIRLIRVSLVLRLIPSLVGLIALIITGNTSILLLVAFAALPTFVLLGGIWAAQQRGWVTPAHVRWMLIFTIAAYAIEMVAPLLAFRYATAHHLIPTEASGIFGAQGNLEARSGRSYPLIFILIPTVLGAWMSGGRGAFRWAGFAILINFSGLAILLADAALSGARWDALGLPFSDFGLFLAQSLVIAMVCYFVGALADRQRAEHAELERASRLLAEQSFVREQLAVTRERMSLSRDLHDTVAHTLAALSVQVNAVGAVLKGEQPEARREIENARLLVKEGLENTRRAIAGLRANLVEDFGLGGALQKQAEAVSQRTGLVVEVDLVGGEPLLNEGTADTIFRIAQEALNNVERHARAEHAWVRLENHPGEPQLIKLSVRDDGIGFNSNEMLDEDRFGLRGMRERAELIGAHIRVDSAAGQGTTVTLTLSH